MTNLLHRMAGPPTRRRGLQLALVAVVMTSAPALVGVLFAGAPDVALWVLTAASVTGALGLIPLLLAVVALVGRPVRPAWLVVVAVVLLLIQPISWILEVTRVVSMQHSVAVLIAIATGSAAGVMAAGLVPVDHERGIPLVLLIPLVVLFAAGVSIAGFVVFALVPAPGPAVVIAILLGVEIMRHRKHDAPDDLPSPVTVA